MQSSTYFQDDAYHAALDRLEDVAHDFDPAAPDVLRTKLIEILGDLGVWPDQCRKANNALAPRLVA